MNNLLLTKKWTGIIITIFTIIFIAACQQGEETPSTDNAAEERQEDTSNNVTNNDTNHTEEISFTDNMDREVVLDGQPERIVVIASEFLKLIYDLDGEAVGRMTTTSVPIPEEAEDVPELGTVSQINTEELLALSPDLVIGSSSWHADLEGILESSNIPLALLSMRSFDDVKEMATLMGEVLGKEELAAEKLQETEAEMKEVQDQLPSDQEPSVVILNVSSGSVSVQRANTTAIEIGDLLRVNNIGKNMEASPDSQTSAPYSLETIAEQQPDYILITIHGSVEAGQEKIAEELEGNPAWNSLKAVQEGNVHIIPSAMYLSNPGFDYADTMKHMAEIVYPDVFGNE
ncbi:ABC transporter substrate-binding protein [Cytobacillus purgationiresistens]|uniref:Iron complex transport system substrate-binding protein n=1 Tax=Cytobacillus purgationiresistens TaxID=863449 RepID=A0ABU0AQM6_9BACI|nr:ABC transporter substrate-binding protein [Cytobacillus purgationiresistens]MDQ0273586.1 iron complex transport system substrate-binding protein [Cytobacillus purgationiresistens]